MEPGIQEINCDHCGEDDLSERRFKISILCSKCTNELEKILNDADIKYDIKIEKIIDCEDLRS